MPHLFSAQGDHAIAEIVARHPLLALDFDGTLAPIVPLPDQARAPLAITRTLAQLVDRLPVAIVTGRSVEDVSGRLGFTPHYIVGNHGAEGLPGYTPVDHQPLVNAWLGALHGNVEIQRSGVRIEDKGQSLSLHYRLARNRDQAREAIQGAISALSPQPRVIGGKCVFNLLPTDAPDKYQAVRLLVREAGCDCAIFTGDDITDDVVFEQAPSDWLTVRIEARDHHHARFHLSLQSEMASFLQRLLAAIQRSHAHLQSSHSAERLPRR
ncbi:MAG: trehalose-phosphatase [Candidatus Dactylopiibacterium carminicum]|nr:MAG: trehalose-phosphatase [Candidatus Dactylopiibacterium carminicum]